MTNYNSQEKDSPIKISRANESRLVVSTFLENPSFLKRSSRKRPVSFLLSTFLYLTLYHQYTGKIWINGITAKLQYYSLEESNVQGPFSSWNAFVVYMKFKIWVLRRSTPSFKWKRSSLIRSCCFCIT